MKYGMEFMANGLKHCYPMWNATYIIKGKDIRNVIIFKRNYRKKISTWVLKLYKCTSIV